MDTCEGTMARDTGGELRPLAVAPEAGAKAIGVSRSQIYKMIASGEIVSITVGRRRLVPVAAFEDWLAAKIDAA